MASFRFASLPFPVHHDCLVDILTFLSFDTIIQEKIICINEAMIADLEEFVCPRVDSLINMLNTKVEGREGKIREHTIFDFLQDQWHQAPMLEGLDAFIERVYSNFRDNCQKIAHVFDKAEESTIEAFKDKILKLEKNVFDDKWLRYP